MSEPVPWTYDRSGTHFVVHQDFNGLCRVCPNLVKFSRTLTEAKARGNLRFSGTADECWGWIDAHNALPAPKPKPKTKRVTQLLLFATAAKENPNA